MEIRRLWLIAVVSYVFACGPDRDGTTADPTGASGSTSDTTPTGGDGVGDPEIEQRCRHSAELTSQAAETRCECLVASGERPDRASCVAESATPESTLECICPIYARDPTSDAFLDCLLPLQQAYADCTVEALCNTAKLRGCADAFARYTQCSPPMAGAAAVAAMCEQP